PNVLSLLLAPRHCISWLCRRPSPPKSDDADAHDQTRHIPRKSKKTTHTSQDARADQQRYTESRGRCVALVGRTTSRARGCSVHQNLATPTLVYHLRPHRRPAPSGTPISETCVRCGSS